jgi:hypothetical protein
MKEYTYANNNHVITFFREMDYLNCRKYYLDHFDTKLTSFETFIELSYINSHPKKIKSIKHILSIEEHDKQQNAEPIRTRWEILDL